MLRRAVPVRALVAGLVIAAAPVTTVVLTVGAGEDALTSLGRAGDTVVTIENGGAFNASDKVFRRNGAQQVADHRRTSATTEQCRWSTRVPGVCDAEPATPAQPAAASGAR